MNQRSHHWGAPPQNSGPVVTMGFNTKMVIDDDWMIWGALISEA